MTWTVPGAGGGRAAGRGKRITIARGTAQGARRARRGRSRVKPNKRGRRILRRAKSLRVALDLAPKYVAGFSGGGMITQELALSCPELVRSLVLNGTYAKVDVRAHRQADSWMTIAMHAETPRAFYEQFRAYIYARAAHEDGRVEAWILELLDIDASPAGRPTSMLTNSSPNCTAADRQPDRGDPRATGSAAAR